MNAVNGYDKLPPISGKTACLTCGCGSHDILSMAAILAVGFGSVNVTRNGKQVYSEPRDESKFWTAQNAENEAAKDPENDWRIHFYAPMYEAHYQRQGIRHWVLYEKGEGFA